MMTERLQAGVGKADITPPLGIHLAGDIARYRPAEEVRHPLYVKALILEAETEKVCLISGDVLGVLRNWTEQIARHVSQMLSCHPDKVIVYGMQSHSAPFVGNHMIRDEYRDLPEELWWLRGGDPRYNQIFFNGVIEAVKKAQQKMRPACLKAVRGIDGRVSYNRRFVMRDGTTQTHPGWCNPDVLHCEGPTDPEVGVLSFEDDSGRPFAFLLHHTCHPTHGYPYNYVCPDWPGLWAEAVEELFDGSIALVANGACGNISPAQHTNPAYQANVYRFTACLTETFKRILPDLQPVASLPLAAKTTWLKIPRRELIAAELNAAKELIASHPEPIYLNAEKSEIEQDWVYAKATLDLAEQYERASWYDYAIQMVRVGDIVIVAWPGEPFVEAQLEFKLQSPARQNFVIHFAGDCAGYIPTRQAFAAGGYETKTANWSKLAPDALETITAASVKMANELFNDK